ncbi:hypothetical protein AESSP_02719 [Aestuariimicrobium sp. T2.26MG-19.2B]|nr:hypothetical protein AESSP_02719 [Aestuariimicrobium sp. T2.26MG-19.2B]
MGEVVEGRRRIFFPVSVFDISQADEMEGQEDASSVVRSLTGDDENGTAAASCQQPATRGSPHSVPSRAYGSLTRILTHV